MRSSMRAAVVVAMLLATVVAADPDRDHKRAEARLARAVAAANKHCGGKLEATYDWAAEAAAATKPLSPDQGIEICGRALEGLAWGCDEVPAKLEAIRAIQHVRCTFDANVTAPKTA